MPVGLRRDGWMVPCLQDCRLLCSQSIWAEFIHPFIHLRPTPKIKCSEWDLLRGKELKDTGMELLRVALCPSEAFSVSSFQKNDFWMDEALQQSLWVMKTNTVYNCTPPDEHSFRHTDHFHHRSHHDLDGPTAFGLLVPIRPSLLPMCLPYFML